MVQTAVAQDPDIAFAGMLGRAEEPLVFNAVLQTAAGITAGRFVVQNGADATECITPSGASAVQALKILGVVLRDIAREPAAFAQYDTISYVRRGRVYVPCETSFDPTSSVYVRHTVTTTELLGAVRTDSDSGKAALIPAKVWNSGDAGDLAEIEICFPYASELDNIQDEVFAGGAYTPTVTAGTNTATPTGVVGWYIRAGSMVRCGGRASLSHTAGAPTASDFQVSLPVASDLAAAGDLAGTATGPKVSLADVVADTTDDTAKVEYSISATGAQTVSWEFSYTIA